MSTQDQAKTVHQIAMQRICTAARKDVVVFAYRVAMPRQRFRCKKHFPPDDEADTSNGHTPAAACDFV